jgi:hypothetical protein
MTRRLIVALAAAGGVAALVTAGAQQSAPPLRLAIAGLVHGHVSGFLRAAQARADVRIVGVYEPDAALLRKYAQRYGLADADVFTDLAAMLDRAKPEAIASFTNTHDHRWSKPLRRVTSP